jgi:hypothetical protein
MECYREFPLATVVYNLITVGGAVVIGAVVVAQYGLGAAAGYLLLLGIALLAVLNQVCTRCGYYGQRCALTLGKVVAVLFERKADGLFFRTAPQVLAMLLLAGVLLAPVVAGVVLLVSGPTGGQVVLLTLLAVLLAAGLAPHTRIVCSHCAQGECGACPMGKWVWTRGRSKRDGAET